MPHDAKGNLLKAGDVVIVPFRVLNVSAGEDHCNVSLESLATMPPDHHMTTTLSAINTRQVIRANAPEDNPQFTLSVTAVDANDPAHGNKAVLS